MRQRLLLLFLVPACTPPDPVTWSLERTQPLDSLPGALAFLSDTPGFAASRLQPPVRSDACTGSVRVAAAGEGGAERYAVWWAPRADSTAWLLAARSTDGGRSWEAPQAVDTLDTATRGCVRPPPAVAADSVTGYVHVAYSMRAPEGIGVFFSHSMDRGRLFHAPVPIVYGERLSEVAIAALRDTVALAFVDPNMRRARIGLAFSRTMGHIFEDRLTVPGGSGVASAPAVTLSSGRVAVAWVERDPTGPARVVVRAGQRQGPSGPR